MRCAIAIFFVAAGLYGTAAISEDEVLAEHLTRSDQLPAEDLEEADDAYLEGYIQALLNAHYYEFNVVVAVVDRTAYLFCLPNNKMLARSILSFVRDIPGIQDAALGEGEPPPRVARREAKETERITGVWFPQATVIFPPLIADPREPMYSAEYRFGDKILGKHSVGVALGDTFPIYQWNNVFRCAGAMQIGIQAGAWSVFNIGDSQAVNDWAQLVNTDYLIGIPLTFAFDNWSFRLRIYHISGHLGDEFIEDNQGIQRKNPSMEAIDCIGQYQLTRALRLYAGPGVVLRSDKSFRLDPLYLQYGAEARAFGRKFFYHRLYGTPFLAMNVQNWQAVDWRFDLSAMIGYEFSKLEGVGRKLRFYAKYRNGYSEGQFFKQTGSYGAVGMSWGF